jgi:hypothetical protein
MIQEPEIALLSIDQWLQEMRTDAVIGQDIQNLQSFAPDGLTRVVLVAVMSWKRFVERNTQMSRRFAK